MSNNKKPSQDEFETQSGNLAKVLDRTRDLGFAGIAEIERALGAGTVREAARKKARLGAEAPVVRAAALHVSAQAERNARVAAIRRSVEIGRDPNTDLRKITGRILDERGRPAMVKVAVSKDGAGQPPLETDRTDRSGTYLIEVTRSAFTAYFRGAKELVVTTFDDAGKPLREVRRPISEKDAPIRVVNLSLGAPKIDEPGKPTSILLTDIPGLGRTRIRKLEKAGIREVAELLTLTPARLATLIDSSEETAERLLRSAEKRLAALT